ncbi:MAG: hypothetical protein ACLT98_10640 [Eggerthellaceae bacterium]
MPGAVDGALILPHARLQQVLPGLVIGALGQMFSPSLARHHHHYGSTGTKSSPRRRHRISGFDIGVSFTSPAAMIVAAFVAMSQARRAATSRSVAHVRHPPPVRDMGAKATVGLPVLPAGTVRS